MKTRMLFFPLLIAFLAALVWSCATTGSNPTGVVADERGIVIPATPLTEADQTAMNNILAKYDKALFKIDTHVKGQFIKRRGTLVDIFTDKKLAASIAENLTKQGFTRSAIRVGKYTAAVEGASTNPQHVSGPSATPVGSGTNPQRVSAPAATPIGTGTNPQRVQQDQLIRDLKPILDKYSKQ